MQNSIMKDELLFKLDEYKFKFVKLIESLFVQMKGADAVAGSPRRRLMSCGGGGSGLPSESNTMPSMYNFEMKKERTNQNDKS